MIIYLLKMTLCASLSLLAYHFFLEKEKMHRFKRIFLLGSLIFSITIPLVEIEVGSSIPAIIEPIVVGSEPENIAQEAYIATNKAQITASGERGIVNPKYLTLITYIAVCLLLLTRFCTNIYRLISSVKKCEKLDYFGTKLVLTERATVPYSFLNYIFIDKEEFQNRNIEEEILLHEHTHAMQKHSIDILFVELLSVIFWFNPVVYWYKNKIKLNHEFLADENVILKCNDISAYQLMLIDKIGEKNKLTLASNFNYLITKKRLIMMKKITSKKKIICKKVMTIPLFLIAFCIFSAKTTAGGFEILTKISIEIQDKKIIPESGISQEELNEYKRIVDKYKESHVGTKVEWKSFDLTDEDWKRLYPLYLRMTKEQRGTVDIHFNGPLNAIKLRSPNKDEWKACIRAENQIWLDGKKVDTSEFTNYSRQNIVFFLYRWAKKEGGISKSYLWTKKGYDAYLEKNKNGISEVDLLEIKPFSMFMIKRDTSDGKRLYMSRLGDY
ncbi:M56 family metallopeptidase [Prevotella sp. 10(H)]|uniref:M56 family metallopeptidase n=1 Tax=Prevotella sp. 10(H) TaxID=1158294 RepID=UPI00068F640C|nr:M56 family metallopeptidase [Prevotella sp. 10(H)]